MKSKKEPTVGLFMFTLDKKFYDQKFIFWKKGSSDSFSNIGNFMNLKFHVILRPARFTSHY